MKNELPFQGSMDERLQKAEEIIGLEFDDKALLQRALTHPSAAKAKIDSNALLGTLGQDMIRLHVAQRLFEKTDAIHSEIERLLGAGEGSLSLITQYAASTHIVGGVSKEIGLSPLLIRGNEKMKVLIREKADVFRSVIGAIFLKHGIEEVQPRLDTWLVEPVIDEDLLNPERRSKGKLILLATSVWGQGGFTYYDEPVEDGSSTSKISIYFGEHFIAVGEGPSSHVAKQNAINNAFEDLHVWHPAYKNEEAE